MTTDLTPYYRRFSDENQFDYLPVNPLFNYTPIISPPKNNFDVDITRSNNETNIDLARTFQRVQKIQAAKEGLLAAIYTNPGTPNWNVDVLGEERGLFRRQPKILSIRIKGYK